MLRRTTIAVLAASLSVPPLAANADLTLPAGGGQPQATIQPSLGLNYIVRTSGDYYHLGDISLFAGTYAPAGWLSASGQTLPISQYTALFSVLGTNYGGDGRTSFSLPDLRGRTPIGAGSNYRLGQRVGGEAVTLTGANLPAHDHSLPGGGITGVTGSPTPAPYNNMQPSLAVNFTMPTTGYYPSRSGGGGTPPANTLGFVGMTTRNQAMLAPGATLAQGQLLPIAQNQALFSLLGTTYGGDGRTTFALPDLQGRAPIGAGAAPGHTTQLLGQESGAASVTLNESQLPSHDHGLASGGTTGVTGGGQPQTNMQPSLALHFIIATNGLYPVRGDGSGLEGTSSDPMLGEIELFAGNFAPSGWMFADGTLLSISQNAALFSILGPTYGGDGRTTFALPDLDTLLAVGAGRGPGLSNWLLGQTDGTETNVLTLAQMPSHTHSYAPAVVPEPSTIVLFGLGLAALGLARRRKAA